MNDYTHQSGTLLTPEQTAQELGMTTQQLRTLLDLGTAPPHMKLGTKTLRFDLEEVQEWARSNGCLPMI